MNKKKQRILYFILIAVTLICIVTASLLSKKGNQEFTLNAIVGKNVNQSFEVNHGLKNCEYGSMDNIMGNFLEFNLALEVERDRITVCGVPSKSGTAVATAFFKEGEKMIYATVTVNINTNGEKDPNTQTFETTVLVNQSISLEYEAAHGFDDCSVAEVTDGSNNYAEFGLTFQATKGGLSLEGTPTKTGVVRASAVYQPTQEGLLPYTAVINLTVSAETTALQTSSTKTNLPDDINNLEYTVELTTNESTEILLPVEHGLSDCEFEEVSDGENTYAEYGLKITPTASGISLSGKPSKEGTAIATICYYTEKQVVCVRLVIIITSIEEEGITAIAGQDFTQTIYYGDMDIEDAGKYLIRQTAQSASILSDYNLTATCGKDAVFIEGTPMQGGTVTVGLEFNDGTRTLTKRIELDIIVPKKLVNTIDGTVGTRMNIVSALDDPGDSAEPFGDWEESLLAVGLDVNCDGKNLYIKGTPTTAGKYRAVFTMMQNGNVVYYVAEIEITGEKGITLTSRTIDGQITLMANIPFEGDYIFTLYRNSARTTEHADGAGGYENEAASTPKHTINLTFRRLNLPIYYFYIEAKQGNKTLVSDFVRIINPNYTPKKTNPFNDLTSDVANIDEILYTVSSGLMNGNTPNEFLPDGGLRVCEAIKMAACLHEYYMTGNVTLKNAEEGAWYATYLNYAIENGIISSVEFAGQCCEPITRAQFATLFASVLPEHEYNEIRKVADGEIQDVDMQESYADEVYRLYRAGILNYSTTFKPTESIVRAQAATIMARMINPAFRTVD